MTQRLLATVFAFSLLVSSFGLAEVNRPEIEPTPMMAAEARLVVSLLEQAHFAGTPISSLDLKELLRDYMSTLDHHRLFFTETDHDHFIEKYAEGLEADLRQGDLEPAFDIFKTYRDRSLARIEWIVDRLEGDFSFDSDRNYQIDRRELPWPADSDEADTLWERRLTYEILADVLNDESVDEAKENVTRRYERLQRTVRETEADEVQELFLSGLSKLYDPHSSFLSASTLEDFSISMRLSLVGIGAQLTSEDGYCTIRELIPGGPAAIDNQLRPNDRIVAVAQEGKEPVDVIDMRLRRVVEMIRGEKGTTVELTIIPADATDSSVRRTISLVRDEIRLTASRAQATIHEVPSKDDKLVPVGVITIPSFYGSAGSGDERETSTTDDVEALIGDLKEAGIEALVLDLRRNGGGLLQEAIRLTGLFIETGPVVRVKSSDGGLRVDPDKNPDVAYSGPLGILVSRNSASASEIVAGALQNYDRAVILGETSTHGKGTVQAIFELENYLFRGLGDSAPKTGAAKMTVQKFYLPDGQSTQNRGVVPDITFPSFNEFLPIGESDLPNAMAWDEITADDWTDERDRFAIRSPLEGDLVSRLKERSEKRQEELEEFKFLRRNIDWLREKQEEKKVSLNLEKRKDQKSADTEFRERMNEISETLARKEFSNEKFRLDSEQDSPDPLPEEAEVDGDELDATDDIGLARTDVGLDIHLRESLRVLADLVELGEPVWKDSTITAHRSPSSSD